jgi:hypothetical protein
MMGNINELKREIIIARLRVLPSNRRTAVGNYGSFTRDELIEHVEKGDEIGKKLIEVQMAFLTAIKTGKLYV